MADPLITLPDTLEITAPITFGFAGPAGPEGPAGPPGDGEGSSTLAALTDVTTYDLPANNTPLTNALSSKANAADLSTVATSGAYADLSGTPAIPTVITTVAGLTDRNTYDFATLNTPVSDALATKAPLVSPSFTTPALGTPSSGTLTNCTFPTLNQSTTGNAATATRLQTARTINGVSFSGLANITVTAAAGTLTGTALNSTVVTSSLTTTGTITSGTWQGTAIADAYIASAATWNAKGAAGQVTTYLVADGIHTITSAAGVVTPNAANGVSQKFPLTENVTDFNPPTNLADGGSMFIQVLQDSTPRTLALDAAWKVMGGGVAADIGTLAAGGYAWLSISRCGADYLISITAQA